MASGNNKDAIKITLEDLANVSVPESAAAAAPAPAPGQTGGKVYGSINTAAGDDPTTETKSKSNILLQGWFYLGAAGLIGTLAAWGITEPFFVDGQGHNWGDFLMIPLIVTLLCMGFALAESIVERSLRKALIRGALALPLGLLAGFILEQVANVIYNIMLHLCFSAGLIQQSNPTHSPAWWISRGIGWMIFGVAGGAVYGIIGQSGKKAKYGILGGILGAGLGGMIFDPIGFATHGGGLSRAIGFALFGTATGIAVGLVESALKDRWLYVTAGPLAGKQFILYKTQTVVGSNQGSDIYLFKDPNILPQHAVIEIQGSRVQLRALGNVFVAGQPVSVRVLQDGDIAQIGRYAFRYKEKQRS